MKSKFFRYLLKAFLLLISNCFVTVKGNAQIAFSTHPGCTAIPQNSTYSFEVDILNLPVGSVVKAKTHGGLWAQSWENDTDSGKLVLLEKDTAYRIEISGNHVKLEIDALMAGEHQHKLEIDIYNKGKLLKSWSQPVVFQAEKIIADVHLLYRSKMYEHVVNRIKIVVSGVPASSVFVSATGGNLMKTGEGLYDFNPSAPADSKVNIEVSAKLSNGRIVKVAQEQYAIESIPDPELQIIPPDTASPASPVIVLIVPGITTLRGPVLSWELELNLSGTKREFKGTGNTLSAEALQAWKQLKPGDSYLFKNVETRMGKNRRILLSKQAVID